VELPFRSFEAAIGCRYCAQELLRTAWYNGFARVLHQGCIELEDVIVTNARSRRRAALRKTQCREAEVAEQISGKRVPGSGSGVRKGDACSDRFVIDDKSTKQAGYRLTAKTLDLLQRLRRETSRLPVLRVGMAGGVELAVLPWRSFQELINE